MKRKCVIALMAAMLFSSEILFSVSSEWGAGIPAKAQDADQYALMQYAAYEDHIEITACDSAATEVVVPSEIEGLPVTVIGDGAFSYCSALTAVSLPDTVTDIGASAFAECTALREIRIPESVGNFGANAFANTPWLMAQQTEHPLVVVNQILISARTDLAEAVIPEAVIGIGDAAFAQCTALRAVTIPNSVIRIGSSAFFGCTGLTAVVIPDGVTHIGNAAFRQCTKLTVAAISDSVTAIGAEAFRDCASLTAVSLPDGISDIADYMFFGCTQLTEVILPDRLTRIGEFAFFECNALETIHIPVGVTSIGKNAFFQCTQFTAVTIPEGVSKLEAYIFFGCSQLEAVILPESVVHISELAFVNCAADFTIHGYSGTAAETFALEYGIPFQSIAAAGVKGDVNSDGIVTIADVVLLSRYLAEDMTVLITPQGLAAGDCDGNNGITVDDNIRILQYLVRKISKL